MFALNHCKCLPRLIRARSGLALAVLCAAFSARPATAQSSGTVQTLGGSGAAGYVDGIKGFSSFNSPQGLAVRGDQLFIADFGNDVVRSMRVGDMFVTTFAGANRPVGLAFDRATNLFVANQGDGSITKFDYFGNYRGVFRPALPGGEITALAIDRGDNLYIAQRRGVISRMSPDGSVSATYGTPADNREFRGVAVFDDGAVLASDAASHVIWRFNGPGTNPIPFAGTLNSPGTTQGEPGFGRLNQPHQIAAGPNGSLVVADRGNHQIRVVSCTGVITILYGVHSSQWFIFPAPDVFPGWWDSTARFAELREPAGVAVDAAGTVYDSETYYHLVRSATGLSFPICSTSGGGGGTSTNAPIPVLNPASGYFPNGTTVTITASNLTGFPRDTRLYYTLDDTDPDEDDTELEIGDDGIAVLNLEGPIDLAGLRVRAFLGTASSPVISARPTLVPVPVLSPNAGYFPMGVDVTVRSTNGFPAGTLLYYTVDGTEPTTNSIPLIHDGNTAVLTWREAARDLRSLRVRAFLGPNAGVTVAGRAVSFPGEPQIQGELGVPLSRTGFNAGIGSFYILPIVANLRDEQTLRSVQFVVELTAGPGAPRLERTDVRVLPMSTNDLIQILPAALVPPDTTINTASGGVNRLAIAYFGTNSGFNVIGHATVAMIGIQFRTQDSLGNRADLDDEYTINVTQISGTSDGVQNLLSLKPMASRAIRFQNISFLEGDTSPTHWYNAGEFGNGFLENGDVNNAVFAAFGFRQPYQGSDVFAAMDVYRVGVLENVIEFNDAGTILRRSLGFESANFRRSRNDAGEWTQTVPGLAAFARQSLRAFSSPSLSTSAWHRDVLIRGGSVQMARASQTIRLPVYMKADAGLTVSGMQFVADVVPANGAPLVNGVKFIRASSIPAPTMNGSAVPGLGTLPATVYARWDNIDPGLAGEVLLGHVEFSVPLNTTLGQGYTVLFHHAGGATIDPDTGSLHGYLFETQRSYVSVNDTEVPESRDTSDDWKEHFFDSSLSPDAAASNDVDGDGFTNLQEYIVGTDPTAVDWSARVQAGRFTFRWVGESGRKYVVETTEDFQGWNAATGQLAGQDAFLEHHELTPSPKARFYRLKVQ
jgi:hypothetical protein